MKTLKKLVGLNDTRGQQGRVSDRLVTSPAKPSPSPSDQVQVLCLQVQVQVQHKGASPSPSRSRINLIQQTKKFMDI